MSNRKNGFTLIEILVVIGIIAILAAIVLIAINPARQFAQAHNTQRSSNVNAILNAIGQYTADHKGVLPPGIPVASDGAADIPSSLCSALIPTYIPSLPTDPKSSFSGSPVTDCTTLTGAATTGYTVMQDSNSRVTVEAVNTELKTGTDPNIKVTR